MWLVFLYAALFFAHMARVLARVGREPPGYTRRDHGRFVAPALLLSDAPAHDAGSDHVHRCAARGFASCSSTRSPTG